MLTKYRDIDKAYVSPADDFLFRFDQEHPHSASQLKEINKHQRIAQLRDSADVTEKDPDIAALFVNF